MNNEIVERILIQRNKAVDDMILGEIRKIATENGVDTIITLNDKAIIQALKKAIPQKPIKKNPICYSKEKNGQEHYAYEYYCPLCFDKLRETEHHCICGQALYWSDTK